MAGRPTEAALRAAQLVAAGMSFRAAAQQAGVSLSTCQRACAAAGVASSNPVGRPAQDAPRLRGQ
jgi:transposase